MMYKQNHHHHMPAAAVSPGRHHYGQAPGGAAAGAYGPAGAAAQAAGGSYLPPPGAGAGYAAGAYSRPSGAYAPQAAAPAHHHAHHAHPHHGAAQRGSVLDPAAVAAAAAAAYGKPEPAGAAAPWTAAPPAQPAWYAAAGSAAAAAEQLPPPPPMVPPPAPVYAPQADNGQAMSVAREFTWHFMRLLRDKQAQLLKCFYGPESQVSYGSTGLASEAWNRAAGDSNIGQVFRTVVSKHLGDVERSQVRTVEAQRSADLASIVMQSTGVLEMKDGSSRPFAHTVVLKSAKNGSWVAVHDIFVLLDNLIPLPFDAAGAATSDATTQTSPLAPRQPPTYQLPSTAAPSLLPEHSPSEDSQPGPAAALAPKAPDAYQHTAGLQQQPIDSAPTATSVPPAPPAASEALTASDAATAATAAAAAANIESERVETLVRGSEVEQPQQQQPPAPPAHEETAPPPAAPESQDQHAQDPAQQQAVEPPAETAAVPEPQEALLVGKKDESAAASAAEAPAAEEATQEAASESPVVAEQPAEQAEHEEESNTLTQHHYSESSYAGRLLAGLKKNEAMKGTVVKRAPPSVANKGKAAEVRPKADSVAKSVWVSQIQGATNAQIATAVANRLKGAPVEGRVVKIERMRTNPSGVIELDSVECVEYLIARGLCINGRDVKVDQYKGGQNRSQGGSGYNGASGMRRPPNGERNSLHQGPKGEAHATSGANGQRRRNYNATDKPGSAAAGRAAAATAPSAAA